MLGNYRVATELVASRVVLSSIKLVHVFVCAYVRARAISSVHVK
jgi:hypothetical protein